MPNDEIRSLVDEIRSANKAYKCVPNYMGDAAADAIETLLAREAEVLELAYPPRYGDLVEMGGKLEVATSRLDKIRAILNPQPAAMAKEKTNAD